MSEVSTIPGADAPAEAVSDPAEVLVNDAPPALVAAAAAERKPTIQEVTDEIGRALNDAHHAERQNRRCARELDAAGETQRAIAQHATADQWKWRAACREAALARLEAMEPHEDKVRELIKAERKKEAAKAARPARRGRAA